MIMKKSEKWKTIFKSKSLIYIVIAFAVAPVAINLGLVFTNIIYEKTGNTLTAKGLNNAEWLGFWKQYLAIAISFVGLCVAYVSSNTDRKHKLQEEQAQQYLEGVRQEENVLVDVTQGFNSIVDVLWQLDCSVACVKIIIVSLIGEIRQKIGTVL